MIDDLFSDMGSVKAPAAPEDYAATLQDLRHKPFRHASASQITTFRRCELRWWFEKIGGLQSPEGKALTFGKLLHSQAETYLVEGRAGWAPTDDEDTLKARKLILTAATAGRLPAEGSVSAADVERAFALVSSNWPVPVVGAIDWMEGDTVNDHKSLSAWKYMRTEEALRADVAGAIYSAAACGTEPEVPTPPVVVHGGDHGPDRIYPVIKAPIHLRPTRFRHVYYRTTEPYQTDERAVLLEPATTAGNLNGIKNTLWDMVVVAKETSPREVKHNTEACYDHGKCPRQGLCGFLGIDVYRRKDKTMIANDNPFLDSFGTEATALATPAALSLKDRLNAAEQEKARAAGMQAAEDPEKPADVADDVVEKKAPKVTKPEPLIPDDERLPKEVRGFLRKHLDSSGASRVRSLLATACTAAGHVIRTVPEDSKKPALLEDIAQFVALLTGERPWPAVDGEKSEKAPKVTTPAKIGAEDCGRLYSIGDAVFTFQIKETESGWQWSVQKDGNFTVGAAASKNEAHIACVAAAHAMAPPKHVPMDGAPSLDGAFDDYPTPKSECDPNPAALVPSAPEKPASEPTQQPAPESPTPEVGPARWLFIDCQPRAGEAVELSDFLAPIHRGIEAEKGVGHYLALGYGEGPKLTSAYLYKALKVGRMTLPEKLIVRRSAPCSQECLPEIGAYYTRDCIVEASR